MRCTFLWLGAATLAGVACAQTAPPVTPDAGAVTAPTMFTQEKVERGREQFHRTCAQCHGRNMVNSGTTSYDLRRFPVDQPDRFVHSVTQGKGNMPAFKDVLDPATIQLLWAYVATRGGKEM